MAIPTNSPEALVTEEDINGKKLELGSFLKLNAPFSTKDAPDAYSYERTRNFQIDWEATFQGAGLADDLEKPRRTALRSHFEKASTLSVSTLLATIVGRRSFAALGEVSARLCEFRDPGFPEVSRGDAAADSK